MFELNRKIVIPYESLLRFPTSRIRTQRDHQLFLGLIKVSAYLQRHQRACQTVEKNGNRTEYIVATLDDYAQAYGLVTSNVVPELFSEPRPRNNAQLLQMLRLMLQTLRLMWEEAEKIVKQGERKEEEGLVERIQRVRFTRQDVMKLTNLSYTQTKERLEKLMRLGALSSESLGRGGRIVYRIAVEGMDEMEDPMEDLLLKDLIPPDELRELWTSAAWK